MFKGIAALFTSGEILNPMVLIGILFGLFLAFYLPLERIIEIFSNYNLYLLILFIAFGYNAIFKKVYKGGGSSEVDYKEMGQNVVFSALKLFFASALSVSFVYVLFTPDEESSSYDQFDDAYIQQQTYPESSEDAVIQ